MPLVPSQPSAPHWGSRRIWLYSFIAILLYEAYTLFPGGHDTLSHTIRDTIRFTPWRVLLLPLWAWLTWHWILLPPGKSLAPNIIDGIIVAVAILWAIVELWLRYGTK